MRVLLFADPAQLSGDAVINYRTLMAGGVPREVFPLAALDENRLRRELAVADWIVDALFGSGLRGPVQPPYDRIIAAINASEARVFAVDIPSGLDSDSGLPLDISVRAHHTATVAALKKGFLNPSAAPWLGRVHLLDMGAPAALLSTIRI